MRDLQLKQGVVGVVDAQFRWVPAYARMKELVDEGFLGEAYHATMNLQLPLSHDNGATFPAIAWQQGETSHLWLGDSSSGASAWRNFGSHCLLMLTHLFGEVEEVVASTDIHLKEWTFPDGSRFTPRTDDVGVALVRFRNGAVATISTTWCTPDAECVFLEIAGSRGRLAIRDRTFGRDPTVPLYAADARPRAGWESTGRYENLPDRLYEVGGTSLRRDGAPETLLPFVRMFDHLLDAVRNGGQGSPSFVEAARVQCAIEAGARSVRRRGWVRVDEVEASLGG